MYKNGIKRLIDILVSGLGIIVLSPVLLILYMLVRVKLGKPALFTQERPGKDEKIFKLYKFRSMTDERDEKGELLPDESRLTRFGKLLRSTSLDELPELFNIVKGDMSLVGPRPLLVRYLPYYTEQERHRHDVRPGLTGLAQVNGRSVLGWEQRFAYDLQYVEHVSFKMDVKVLGMTVEKVLKRSGTFSGAAQEIEDFDIYRMGKPERVTPYYLVHRGKFHENCKAVEEAFENAWEGNVLYGYSTKTNHHPVLLNFAKDRGWYAEVVSAKELSYVQELGFGAGDIICNGPVKGKMLEEALEKRYILNLDSIQEIQELCACVKGRKINPENLQIGIRINFDLEKECPGETSAGDQVGRFGICYENGDVKRAIALLSENGIPVKGLHMHSSTKTRSLRIYEALSRMAGRIVEEFCLSLDFIDIGGGFFGGMVLPGKPLMKEYANVIAEELKKKMDPLKVTLIVEPGACVLATAVDYVAEVSNLREIRGERVVTLDGTVLHINPFMAKRTPLFTLENAGQSEKVIPVQHICGCTCMEMDRFCTLNETGEIKNGSRFIFHGAGSYTMAFNSNFIVDPPLVYVDED